MATRFYLPSSGSPAVSPAYDPEWDTKGNAVRRPLVTTKTGTAKVTPRITLQSSPALQDVLFFQFVSDPLAAQTLSGTMVGYILTQEGLSAVNARSQIIAYVVNNAGDTVRGVLYAGDFDGGTGNPTDEFRSGYAGVQARRFPRSPAVLNAVNTQEGDRLVVEVGARAHRTNTNTGPTYGVDIMIGDNGASDVPENLTSTDTADDPWIEFSMDILWMGAGGPSANPTFSYFFID